MNWKRRTTVTKVIIGSVLTIVVAAVGCEDPPLEPVGQDQAPRSSTSTAMGSCSDAGAAYFQGLFGCTDQIYVDVNNIAGVDTAVIKRALAGLRSVFSGSGPNQVPLPLLLPYGVSTGADVVATLTINGTESSSYWCGEGTPLTATVYGTAGGCPDGVDGTPDPDLQRVLTTELAAALGFDEFPYPEPALEGCLNYGIGSRAACSHDYQMVYYAFGYRSTEPEYNESIVENLSLTPSSVTLGFGDTISFRLASAASPAVSPAVPSTYVVDAVWSLAMAPQASATFLSRDAGSALVKASSTEEGQGTVGATLRPDRRVAWPEPSAFGSIAVLESNVGGPYIHPEAPQIASIVVNDNDLVYVNFGVDTNVSAVAYDQFGSPVAGTTFTWTIDDPSVATITGSNIGDSVSLTAGQQGSTTLHAYASGIKGSVALWYCGKAVACP